MQIFIAVLKTYEIHLIDSLYILFYTSDRGKPYPSSLYVCLISCSIYDHIFSNMVMLQDNKAIQGKNMSIMVHIA